MKDPLHNSGGGRCVRRCLPEKGGERFGGRDGIGEDLGGQRLSKDVMGEIFALEGEKVGMVGW